VRWIAGPAWCGTPTDYLPLLWGGSLPDEIVTFNVAHVNAMIGPPHPALEFDSH